LWTLLPYVFLDLFVVTILAQSPFLLFQWVQIFKLASAQQIPSLSRV